MSIPAGNSVTRSHLIHGVFFAIGEMLDMNKITDFFIALGALILVVVVVAFVISTEVLGLAIQA